MSYFVEKLFRSDAMQRFYASSGKKLAALNYMITYLQLFNWDYALVHTPDLDFSKQASWLVQPNFTKKQFSQVWRIF